MGKRGSAFKSDGRYWLHNDKHVERPMAFSRRYLSVVVSSIKQRRGDSDLVLAEYMSLWGVDTGSVLDCNPKTKRSLYFRPGVVTYSSGRSTRHAPAPSMHVCVSPPHLPPQPPPRLLSVPPVAHSALARLLQPGFQALGNALFAKEVLLPFGLVQEACF